MAAVTADVAAALRPPWPYYGKLLLTAAAAAVTAAAAAVTATAVTIMAVLEAVTAAIQAMGEVPDHN